VVQSRLEPVLRELVLVIQYDADIHRLDVSIQSPDAGAQD